MLNTSTKTHAEKILDSGSTAYYVPFEKHCEVLKIISRNVWRKYRRFKCHRRKRKKFPALLFMIYSHTQY